MQSINAFFYGVITFILLIAVGVIYFFGNKFLEDENDLVGYWKIENVNSTPIPNKKYYSKEQERILLQRDSILNRKKDSLFLEFTTSTFVVRNTNNGKLETNFFETEKPISWHYLKDRNQIALYRKKEPDVFWEIKKLSNSTLIIKTMYGVSEWKIEFSKKMRM